MDQANNQRADITTMEKSRSRLALFEDGKEKYWVDGKPSARAFARQLGENETTVRHQLVAAVDERNIKTSSIIIGLEQPNLTEDSEHYSVTVCLRGDPQTRTELISLAASGDITNSKMLFDAAKAIEANPEAKAEIIALIKAGDIVHKALQDSRLDAAGMTEGLC
jgi:hypothetical protein